MTPRSVQIWFQNRRQRLLKPLREGEQGAADHQNEPLHEAYTTRKSDEELRDDGLTNRASADDLSADNKFHLRQDPVNGSTAQQSPLKCCETGRSCGAASSTSIPREGRSAWFVSARAPPLTLLSQPVAAGHVSHSAAALLVQALIQQLDGRSNPAACHEDEGTHGVIATTAPTPHHAAATGTQAQMQPSSGLGVQVANSSQLNCWRTKSPSVQLVPRSPHEYNCWHTPSTSRSYHDSPTIWLTSVCNHRRASTACCFFPLALMFSSTVKLATSHT